MRVPTVGRVSTMGSKRIGSREREQRFRARLFTYAIVSHAVGVATRGRRGNTPTEYVSLD